MEEVDINKNEYDCDCEKSKDENKIKCDNVYKEYQNLNGFYLKISYEHENIIIIIYNWKRFYKKDINWHNISSKYNDYFKNDDIKKGYEKIINLINDNNYDIKENEEENKIILKLNIKNHKEEIIFDLLYTPDLNIDIDLLYKILSFEIKQLKEKNEITISQLKEGNKKMKEDLKNLIKNKLSKPKIIEKKNLVLVNCDKSSELNIYDKNYGNEIFNALKNEGCDNLKELRLYNINISDINRLKEVRLEKLRILGLNDNKIKDITILKDIKFESLEELWLSNNKINDISVLEKCDLEYLVKLDLSINDISNINIFKKTKLKNLKELFLYKNKIEDIKYLENEEFKNLEKLDLSLNLITDISIFSDEKNIFNKLKYLNLSHNKIDDINCLQNIGSGGYIFGFFSSSNNPLSNLRNLSLVNNPIDIGKNNRTLNYLQSLYINFRI